MAEALGQNAPSKKTITPGNTELTLKDIQPKKESSLIGLKNLFIRTAVTTWGDNQNRNKETVVQLIYKAPKKDTKKK